MSKFTYLISTLCITCCINASFANNASGAIGKDNSINHNVNNHRKIQHQHWDYKNKHKKAKTKKSASA